MLDKLDMLDMLGMYVDMQLRCSVLSSPSNMFEMPAVIQLHHHADNTT